MLAPSPPAVITRAGPSGATSSSTAIKNEPVVYLAGQLKRLSSLRLNCSMITTQNARICAPPCCREHEDRRANNRRRVPEKNGKVDLTNFPSSAICSSPHNNAVTQRPLFGMCARCGCVGTAAARLRRLEGRRDMPAAGQRDHRLAGQHPGRARSAGRPGAVSWSAGGAEHCSAAASASRPWPSRQSGRCSLWRLQ